MHPARVLQVPPSLHGCGAVRTWSSVIQHGHLVRHRDFLSLAIGKSMKTLGIILCIGRSNKFLLVLAKLRSMFITGSAMHITPT